MSDPRRDGVVRVLARASAAVVRLLPRRLREQYAREMAYTIAARIEARGREDGVLAAVRCALGESLDIACVAVRARTGGRRGALAAAVVTLAIAVPLTRGPVPPSSTASRMSLAAPAVTATSALPQADSTADPADPLVDLYATLALPRGERVPRLIALMRHRFEPSTRPRYLEVESTLCSSREYRRLYEAMLADPRLTDAERIEVIEAAARRIDRSVELADLIVVGGATERQSAAVHAAYRRAAAVIDLDRERMRAASALASRAPAPT